MLIVRSVFAAPRWRNSLVFCFGLAALSCSGANSKLNPVQGKVLYKGQPAAGAVVTLHPAGAGVATIRPTGLTGADGTFTVTTGQSAGAPAGSYTVTVIWPQEIAPANKKAFTTEMPDSQDRLKGAYSDAAASQLKADVKDGPNQLPTIELK